MSLNSVQIEMAELMADWCCTPHKCWWHERKKKQKSDSFPAFLCKITNLQEASDCAGTMSDETNQPDAMPVFMINITKFQCALWLKHLAAHLWKPMFFNETLVIKWIPWLFRHKTAGEDKTTHNLRSGWSPPPSPITPSCFLCVEFSISVCLSFPPIFFLILLLKMSLSSNAGLISHSRFSVLPSVPVLPLCSCLPSPFHSFYLFPHSSLIHAMQRSSASVSDTLQP